MKSIFLLFLFLMGPLSFASGGGGGATSYAPSNLGPQPLRIQSIRDRVDSLRKDLGVSINKVGGDDKTFILEGTYRDELKFKSFVQKLKESIKAEEEFKLKVKKRSFAGKISYDFVFKGSNRWK